MEQSRYLVPATGQPLAVSLAVPCPLQLVQVEGSRLPARSPWAAETRLPMAMGLLALEAGGWSRWTLTLALALALASAFLGPPSGSEWWSWSLVD